MNRISSVVSSVNMGSCFRSQHFSFCHSNSLTFARGGDNSGYISEFIFFSLYLVPTLNLDLSKKENPRKRFHDVVPQRSRTIALKYSRAKKSRKHFLTQFVSFFLVYLIYRFTNLLDRTLPWGGAFQLTGTKATIQTFSS